MGKSRDDFFNLPSANGLPSACCALSGDAVSPASRLLHLGAKKHACIARTVQPKFSLWNVIIPGFRARFRMTEPNVAGMSPAGAGQERQPSQSRVQGSLLIIGVRLSIGGTSIAALNRIVKRYRIVTNASETFNAARWRWQHQCYPPVSCPPFHGVSRTSG